MDRVELSKEQKKKAIEDIKYFYSSERGEELGDLAAGLILDFIIEKMAPYFYNQAITDIQKYMSEKVEDLYGLMVQGG